MSGQKGNSKSLEAECVKKGKGKEHVNYIVHAERRTTKWRFCWISSSRILPWILAQ